ncbi:hypothetical protein GALMADRAFT_269552 [Galerina marginata CBS 339.88]|uniref:DUF4470 domain-containing protein n=1 Tax=Galerina marginata (strain CBS 339.88) TaxID=685588 RepID=A0A067ST02_GALM3|nr:hypothetical protein GALMADRAFT_269552 [Galerina marginata CBS 339.88]
MAEIANQEGNTYYKGGNYLQAQKCFQEATKINPHEPKYPSNLSAVQYELGRYPACISTIAVAWTRLASQNSMHKSSDLSESDPLAIKLATRLAKAKINGVCNRTISLHSKSAAPLTPNQTASKTIEEDIEKFAVLERAESGDPKIKDMKSAWVQWRALRDDCALHTRKDCKTIIANAESRLRSIPIFKCPPDPTLEYFRFGHDQIQSFMNGINGSAMDPYALDSPQHSHQKSWSFLFGGSGDARHVFATVIHLADMANEFGLDERLDLLTVHMTLMDIHPATLARVIVILAILHQILQTRLSNDKIKRVELHATLFYLYTSMLMPEYCRQIVIDTAKKLAEEIPKGTYSLSKCLHVNERSMDAILEVLRYWSTPLPKSTKLFLQRNSDFRSLIPGPYAFTSEMNNLLDPVLSESRKKHMNARVGSLYAYSDPDAELAIYKRVKVLLPPKSLLSRHPALSNLVNSYKGASDALYAAASREVEQTWVPNPTLFDQVSTEHPDFGQENGYPNVSTNPFDTLTSFSEFASEFHKGKPPVSSSGKSGFAATSRFFELVADAVWELQNTLKIEMVLGDVITGLPRLFSGELGHRPKEFPTNYSRMFLSNVPDYTNGALNTAVHLVQHLEPKALIMSNCLLNTGSFPTILDFCYSYTLLLPQDLPRILGCEIINPGRTAFDDIALQQLSLPRSLDQLASKKELHNWLAHLLLCTLCNGIPRHPPARIDLPNNLNAYLHVLVHLSRVGFPSHWIGDFLQSLVSNNLITDLQPYLGRTPIPKSEIRNRKSSPRKVNLEAWQAELQVMLALTIPALPFTVALPPDYPQFSDIQTFKATVRPIDLKKHRLANQWAVLVSGFTKTIGLMFYKPTKDIDADFLAQRISAIIEGDRDVRDAQVQILLSQESVDLRKGELSWKLSRAWNEKMKKEGWFLAAFRTDLRVAVSTPIAVSDCLETS